MRERLEKVRAACGPREREAREAYERALDSADDTTLDALHEGIGRARYEDRRAEVASLRGRGGWPPRYFAAVVEQDGEQVLLALECGLELVENAQDLLLVPREKLCMLDMQPLPAGRYAHARAAGWTHTVCARGVRKLKGEGN